MPLSWGPQVLGPHNLSPRIIPHLQNRSLVLWPPQALDPHNLSLCIGVLYYPAPQSVAGTLDLQTLGLLAQGGAYRQDLDLAPYFLSLHVHVRG